MPPLFIGGFYLFASGVWLLVFEKGAGSVCMIMRDETSFISLFIGVFVFVCFFCLFVFEKGADCVCMIRKSANMESDGYWTNTTINLFYYMEEYI